MVAACKGRRVPGLLQPAEGGRRAYSHVGQRMDTGVLVAFDEAQVEVQGQVLVHRDSKRAGRSEVPRKVERQDQGGNPSCRGAYRRQASLSYKLAFHAYRRHLRLLVSLS